MQFNNTRGVTMSIFKDIVKWTKGEDDEDDFEEFTPRTRRNQPAQEIEPVAASVPDHRKSDKVVNIHATTQLSVVLVKPERFENAAEIAESDAKAKALEMIEKAKADASALVNEKLLNAETDADALIQKAKAEAEEIIKSARNASDKHDISSAKRDEAIKACLSKLV